MNKQLQIRIILTFVVLAWGILPGLAPGTAVAQEIVDVLSLLSSGDATVTTSPYDIGSPENLFDGDTNSICRSASVNPMLVTLEFVVPQPVERFRVMFNAGDNGWCVEGADNLADLESGDGSYLLLVPWRSGVEWTWHEATIAEPETVSFLRLTIERLTGDDYVHLNEWEIYTPDEWFQITDFSYDADAGLAELEWGSHINSWYAVESSGDLSSWELVDLIKADDIFTNWSETLTDPPDSWFWHVRNAAPEERPIVTKKILVLNYDPIIEDAEGDRLHEMLGWYDPYDLTMSYLEDLHYSSHEYVDWEIVEFRDIDEWPLKADGFRYTDDSYLDSYFDSEEFPWHHPDGVDYEEVIATQGLDELVQSGEVDEVIMWGGPYFGYWESQMVGSTAYWCNSGPIVHAGTPLYVIMGLNYERGVAEAIHSFGHRAESIMWHVYGSWSSDGTINHLWDRFTRVNYQHGSVPAGCGNVHFPANGTGDYDYANTGLVLSEADDWLNFPEFTGYTHYVNCDTWGGGDYQRNYLNWWYERMPHAAGRNADGKLNNWWGYLVDMNEYNESR